MIGRSIFHTIQTCARGPLLYVKKFGYKTPLQCVCIIIRKMKKCLFGSSSWTKRWSWPTRSWYCIPPNTFHEQRDIQHVPFYDAREVFVQKSIRKCARLRQKILLLRWFKRHTRNISGGKSRTLGQRKKSNLRAAKFEFEAIRLACAVVSVI